MECLFNFFIRRGKKRLNTLNVLKTLIVNFALFPFNEALKFPVLIYGKCRLDDLSGKIILCNNLRMGCLKIGLASPLRSFDSVSCLSIRGHLVVGDNVVMRRGARISVNFGATLNIESGVLISDNCSIICLKNIHIGKNSYLGNNVSVMDSDFHYVADVSKKNVRTATKRVCIGADNWIAAWNVVKKGAVTPDGTIVAGPYSMIGKDYTNLVKENCMIGGCPAKLIKENVLFVNNLEMEKKLAEYFQKNECDYAFEDVDFRWK